MGKEVGWKVAEIYIDRRIDEILPQASKPTF